MLITFIRQPFVNLCSVNFMLSQYFIVLLYFYFRSPLCSTFFDFDPSDLMDTINVSYSLKLK